MSSNASSQTQSLDLKDDLNQARIEQNYTQSILLSSTSSKSKRSSKYLPTQSDIFDYRESISELLKQVNAEQNLKTPQSKFKNRKAIDLTKTMTIKGKKGKLYQQICPVCLAEFQHPFGVLQCNHKFCFQCIEVWSKTSTACPCCRKKYDKIIKINQDKNTQQIQVIEKNMVFKEQDYFVCYVCGSGNNQNVLLICDMCDFYCCHIYCDPELNNTIPEGNWFCRNCQVTVQIPTIDVSGISSIQQARSQEQDKPIAQRTRSRNVQSEAYIFRRLRRRR